MHEKDLKISNGIEDSNKPQRELEKIIVQKEIQDVMKGVMMIDVMIDESDMRIVMKALDAMMIEDGMNVSRQGIKESITRAIMKWIGMINSRMSPL
jgi:hypothetical protein